MKSKVPPGWTARILCEHSKIISGGTPSTKNAKFWMGKIPWITSADIENVNTIKPKRYISESAIKNSATNLIPKDNIVFVSRVGLGKVAINRFDLCISQDSQGIIFDKNIFDLIYLANYLSILAQRFIHLNQGSAIKGILKEDLASLEILCPPLSEQKKIAEILSTWDRAIETLDKLISAKTRLKKGLMQKLLNSRGKPTRLKDIAEIIFSNVDKKLYSGQRQVLLCNYLDVYNNTYITSKLPFMQATASEAEIRKFGLKEGDVIITKDSETPVDIGVPAVVVEKLTGVVCGYHLAIIRPDMNKINPIYLAKELRTLRIKKQFYKYANGATRFGLGSGDIGKIDLFVPKLTDQNRISKLFQSLDRELSLFATLKEYWQSQKQGLMQKLLTGKIRVKI